jgi:flagellar hook protein FlgE
MLRALSTGFKSSRTAFAALLSQTLAGEHAPTTSVGGRDARQLGLGVNPPAVRDVFPQGTIQATDNGTGGRGTLIGGALGGAKVAIQPQEADPWSP